MSDPRNNRIDYLEITTRDISKCKAFFSNFGGWQFTDFGDDYAAFNDSGPGGGPDGRLNGGFVVGEPGEGTLVVFYFDDLATAKTSVLHLGGTITKDVFSFPGGHRFEFTEPGGAHFAVWSEEQRFH